jgi:hypothetical protein
MFVWRSIPLLRGSIEFGRASRAPEIGLPRTVPDGPTQVGKTGCPTEPITPVPAAAMRHPSGDRADHPVNGGTTVRRAGVEPKGKAAGEREGFQKWGLDLITDQSGFGPRRAFGLRCRLDLN